MMNNILKFPKQETISDNDKLFSEIEDQAEIIKKQKEEIKKMLESKERSKNV
jgi:hypothetical protein|tara:strand:- start:4075 stop:4230 length:156 start_codon:yes stop_codon:yes gene_type:complete